jgi:hypothetical protein
VVADDDLDIQFAQNLLSFRAVSGCVHLIVVAQDTNEELHDGLFILNEEERSSFGILGFKVISEGNHLTIYIIIITNQTIYYGKHNLVQLTRLEADLISLYL